MHQYDRGVKDNILFSWQEGDRTYAFDLGSENGKRETRRKHEGVEIGTAA